MTQRTALWKDLAFIKHHRNSTRRHPERHKKNEMVAGEGKKAKFWAVRPRGGPAEGGPSPTTTTTMTTTTPTPPEMEGGGQTQKWVGGEERRKGANTTSANHDFGQFPLRPISTSANFWMLNFWTTKGPKGWGPEGWFMADFGQSNFGQTDFGNCGLDRLCQTIFGPICVVCVCVCCGVVVVFKIFGIVSKIWELPQTPH